MIKTRRIAALLNCDGGTLRSMDVDALSDRMTQSWEEQGHTIEVHYVAGADLLDQLEDAGASPDNDTIIVAGGDGTVSAGAATAWRHGKALGVLPAGTMNLFSRSLGSPLDLDEAIDAIGHGHIAKCDIATANERPFVHMFGVGLHPRAMNLRDRLDYNSRYGKMVASAKALMRVIRKPVAFRVNIFQDGVPKDRRLSALSISNNRLSEGHLPYADHIDQGVLGIYMSEARSPWQSAKLVADILRGSWSENDTVSKSTARNVKLEFPRKRRNANATIDGEVIPLESEVEISIHPGELRVIIPPDPSEEDL